MISATEEELKSKQLLITVITNQNASVGSTSISLFEVATGPTMFDLGLESKSKGSLKGLI
jgi:hypothetical protein